MRVMVPQKSHWNDLNFTAYLEKSGLLKELWSNELAAPARRSFIYRSGRQESLS